MKKFLLFGLILFFILTLPCVAKSQNNPKNQAEKFLDRIINGDIDNAFDKIFEGTFLPSKRPDEIKFTKNQTKAGLPIYGKLIGKELISETSYGSHIVKLKYALFTEIIPIVWIFHFYKPDDKWMVYNITFNDRFTFLDM
jgi:hypothetical protein